MSAESWKIENDLCRCCHSEGSHKNFSEPCLEGEEETYSDMLQLTLDINITPVSGPLGTVTYTICEACILRLQDAWSFKQQVLQCETRFHDLYTKNIIKMEPNTIIVDVKKEAADSENEDFKVEKLDDSDDDFAMSFDDGMKSDDSEEPAQKAKPKAKPKAKGRAKAKAPPKKKPAARPTTKAVPKEGQEEEKKGRCPKSTEDNIEIRALAFSKVANKNFLIVDPEPVGSLQLAKRSEVYKHQENIASIILSSNATPIRWSFTGFGCSFCAIDFQDPTELKTHTLNTHDDYEKSSFMVGVTMNNFIVKLDITNLQCELCSCSLDSLEELENHLTSAHGTVFHKDLKSHVVPFKFEGEEYCCVFCKHEFKSFKNLVEHMNKHFRNHVCDVCDNGFVNRHMLRRHTYRHRKGVFTCPLCSKVFDAKVKQKAHERAVHVSNNMRSKCGYCGERFSDYTKKNQHMVKMHGAKALVLKCQACNKSFDNQRSLTVHTKFYHMLAKRRRGKKKSQ